MTAAVNYNEAYNVRTFFRDLPLGEAKLLLALIQGEIDERTVTSNTTPAAKTVRRGRPAGSKNKKAATTAPAQVHEEPAVAAV